MLLQMQLLLFLLSSVISVTASGNYQILYAEGLSSYNEEEWNTAIDKFERALSDYKEVKKARETCYKECSGEKSTIPSDYVDDEQLHFFHTLLQKSSCHNKCKKRLMGSDYKLTERVSTKIEENMANGEIHNYIQMSMFNMKNFSAAAGHAATHLYFNPTSNIAKSNIAFYRSLKELSKDDLRPLYTKAYRDLYEEGQALYNNDEYDKMVVKFEEALKEYYEEIERCRLECEGPQEFDGSQLFVEAMWNYHYAYLQCKHSCPRKLGNFRDEIHDVDFLGSYYHYLTYGYFNVKRMKDAAKATMTHLRIEPQSKIAVMNKGYIKQQPGITIKDFVEREDAKPLLDRMEREQKVLDMIKKLSKGEDTARILEKDMNDEELLEEDYKKFPVIKEESEEKTDEKEASEKMEEKKEDSKREETNDKKENKLTILETPADHGGVDRVLADGLLTTEQCQSLMDLAKNCIEGDGYQKKSPHTPHEKFEGLTVLDAAKGAVRKKMSKEQVQLYFDASNLVKTMLVEQFNLTKTLYFSFTHLVCRTALPSTPDRRDLSHPVHADNCVQEEHNGECHKKSPAYTWRDYSAILYLNDDFEGGKFFFAHSPFNTTPQHYVLPKCGRTVGFSAGKENMHGVTAITSGKRCAVALWFTFDPNYRETTFDEAQILLKGAF